MELRKISHAGIETAYRDTGGPGLPFLLVHGFTGSMLDFQDELEYLGTGRRVIILDQRGHGDSTNSGRLEDYTLDTLVADLLSFIRALGIEQLDILGHSLGGMVVLRAVLEQPDLFNSLILMDTAAAGLKVKMEFPEKLYPVLRQKGVQMLLAGMQSQKKNEATQNGIDHLGEAEHYRRIEQKLTQMDPEAFIALQLELSNQDSVLENLKSLSMPTTILLGVADEAFIEPSKLMHENLAGSVYVEVEKAAHSPQYENNQAWRKTLNDHFLRL